jgi:signal transduction histidine kinase
LWREWRERPLSDWKGARLFRFGSWPVTVAWRTGSNGLTIVAALPGHLQDRWRSTWTERRLAVALLDSDGHQVVSSGPTAAPIAARASSDSGLPWTVLVASADPARELAEFSGLRGLLFAFLGLAAVVVGLAGYLVVRVRRREEAVLHLHAESSAVLSHRLKKPIGVIRHVVDLLKQDPNLAEAGRRECYDALDHEATRLHWLVNHLVDPAPGEPRLQEATSDVEVGTWLAGLVDQVRRDTPAASGHPVVLAVDPGTPTVRLQRRAMELAVRSLVDHAAKYSMPGSPIHVSAGVTGSRLTIRVREEGSGLTTASELAGRSAPSHGASGHQHSGRSHGLDLTLVRDIAHSHGGDLSVSTELGRGTTFTVSLPVTDSPRPRPSS